jgi:hypothetical protein
MISLSKQKIKEEQECRTHSFAFSAPKYIAQVPHISWNFDDFFEEKTNSKNGLITNKKEEDKHEVKKEPTTKNVNSKNDVVQKVLIPKHHIKPEIKSLKKDNLKENRILKIYYIVSSFIVMGMVGYAYYWMANTKYDVEKEQAQLITDLVSKPTLKQAQSQMYKNWDDYFLYSFWSVHNPEIKIIKNHIALSYSLNKQDCNLVKDGFLHSKDLMKTLNIIMDSKAVDSEKQLKELSCSNNDENDWMFISKNEITSK